MRTKINLGLVEGRHEMPVDDYFFKSEDISFPINPAELQRVAAKKLDSLGVSQCAGDITVYVTGLTPALVAVIKLAITRGHYLTVKYHDRDTNNWVEDKILSSLDDCSFDAGFPAWFAYI